ncbi:hypothetical protein Dimus_005835 [Dionaea muscipula]
MKKSKPLSSQPYSETMEDPSPIRTESIPIPPLVDSGDLPMLVDIAVENVLDLIPLHTIVTEGSISKRSNEAKIKEDEDEVELVKENVTKSAEKKRKKSEKSSKEVKKRSKASRKRKMVNPSTSRKGKEKVTEEPDDEESDPDFLDEELEKESHDEESIELVDESEEEGSMTEGGTTDQKKKRRIKTGKHTSSTISKFVKRDVIRGLVFDCVWICGRVTRSNEAEIKEDEDEVEFVKEVRGDTTIKLRRSHRKKPDTKEVGITIKPTSRPVKLVKKKQAEPEEKEERVQRSKGKATVVKQREESGK